ncbi:MAG: LysR substrate-binding domain-containing protein [Acidithiobacillus sp.]|nr:LysR substrate-binding domain-containing protein [Acidithiobacillus sp.]
MSVRQVTLHQLRIFTVLARHLSMSKAAAELHQTPSALSLQIKQLSENLGVSLYEQVGKKLFLTSAGEIVAAAGGELQRHLESLLDELAAEQQLERGRLRLCITSTAEYFAPRLLGAFCAAHPGIEAHLEIVNRNSILERLRENLDDVYIMGQVPEEIDGIAQPFLDNPIVVIAAASHPLAAERSIPLARLGKEPFILREAGSGTRLTAENYLAEQGIKLKPRMTLSSNEAVKQLVAGGLGLGILARHTISSELASGALCILDVEGFPILRKWHAVQRKGKSPSAVTRSFLEFLLHSGRNDRASD